MIARLASFFALSLALWPTTAQADGARRTVRAEARAPTVQVVRMTVRGREARPHVITEIKRAEVRFGVGTTAYAWPSAHRAARGR